VHEIEVSLKKTYGTMSLKEKYPDEKSIRMFSKIVKIKKPSVPIYLVNTGANVVQTPEMARMVHA
jgi:hypothetical protein